MESERKIGPNLPIEKLPCLMQAMGLYLSNQELDDMINEVKYGKFIENEKTSYSVSLEDAIQLYINHRPYQSLTKEQLEICLAHAKRLEPGRPSPLGPVKKLDRNDIVKTEGLASLIQQFGESMPQDEISSAFQTILFNEDPYFGELPSDFTAKEFIGNILGLAKAE